MSDARYAFLMGEDGNQGGGLTKAEMREGWHFCADFDGLLRHFNASCTCKPWTDDQIERFGESDDD